jgi:hypothetical protein
MYNINLICTGHTENGKCNSTELLKIIEIIKPEVVFEELPVSIFNECYNENMHDLLIEQKAIKQYKNKNEIKHIPVDTYKSPNFPCEDCGSALSQIFKLDREYYKTLCEHHNLIKMYGLQYLNSEQSDICLEKIIKQEIIIIKRLNSKKMSDLYKLRIDIDDKREDEILNNIYNYSKKQNYNNAIMFTGASHRKSILRKIDEHYGKEEVKLNWIFDGIKNIVSAQTAYNRTVYASPPVGGSGYEKPQSG